MVDRWPGAVEPCRGTLVTASRGAWFAEAVGFRRRWRMVGRRVVEEPAAVPIM
ncbi:hypothetical protein [Micromonospora sp. NPDC002717]|uniref:hypothetical protein n=1 Tax=Micromonospora sp. NPDC002717 TaxID=3154424 RepID=UPI00331BE80F